MSRGRLDGFTDGGAEIFGERGKVREGGGRERRIAGRGLFVERRQFCFRREPIFKSQGFTEEIADFLYAGEGSERVVGLERRGGVG